jgi:hypothetical protein
MADLTILQSAKQGTRQFMAVATDKMALASATVTRGETHVSATGRIIAGFLQCSGTNRGNIVSERFYARDAEWNCLGPHVVYVFIFINFSVLRPVYETL